MNLFASFEQNKKWHPFFINLVCFMMINADIPRYDDSYEAKFYDVNKGRLFPIMKAFGKRMSLKECAFSCIQFLDCESFNYNDKSNVCELCNDVFDEYEAVDNRLESWYNYATPPKQDGGFTQWAKWSDCPNSSRCDEATHMRYRTCTNPIPNFGGTDCFGDRVKRKICNFPCSSKQNTFDICLSKDNLKGYFEAKYTGEIKEVVFYHKNGSFRCHEDPTLIDAYWGCVYYYDNCAKHNCFSVHIFEKESGEILVPPVGLVKSAFGGYNLPSQTEANPAKITLKVKQEGYKVTRGKKYYVTFGYYHTYNYNYTELSKGHGIHCIDVEFIYTSI